MNEPPFTFAWAPYFSFEFHKIALYFTEIILIFLLKSISFNYFVLEIKKKHRSLRI